jgi:multidrug efflux pump subunit AcrA (membrane-fusion protein)
MAKGTTKGVYARWQRAQDARRLAEIEASIAQQLALVRSLATPHGRDTTQADDLLRALLHARDALIEQRQANMPKTAAPPPAATTDG